MRNARKSTTYRSSQRAKAVRLGEPGSVPFLAERLDRLVRDLGNNHVASLLGVSVSQPSRWRSGAERISADSQRRLLDLDYVYSRLLQLFSMEQSEIWLRSQNAHLGARPIDVLRLRGPSAILPAIEAEAQDAYA
jgi:transcriptional regulator with XRE-family HTH domain